MKIVMGVLFGIVLWGVDGIVQTGPALFAQQTSTGQAAPAGPLKIAPGSVIPVHLSKAIDSKKVKPGDEVTAEVIEDMKAQNGQVIVPKDTKVIGHVTQAQARTKQQKESDLGIAFDQAVMNGTNMRLPMSIQAVIAPVSPDSANETAGQAGAPGGTASGTSADNNRPETNQRPPITGKTEGVVGFSNLNLTQAQDGKDGSVISSTKSDVKLESGTLFLLRVS